MSRKPFIAGNWKMNNTISEGIALVEELKDLVCEIDGVDIAVCPTYVALSEIGKNIRNTNISLGGQCCFWL